MLTGISHFFNEEYLLPWWVKHHLPLFDRCIMIDYHSTDRSRAIIQELAPHWEIRTSRNLEFASDLIDLEVMDIERECDGWKVVLNTTEFLCAHDLHTTLKRLENKRCKAFKLRGIILVDDPDSSYPTPDRESPLIGQRWHGFIEDNTREAVTRHRLLHRHPDGAYVPGRHETRHKSKQLYNSATVVHCLYSPWSSEFIARKAQMQKQIPKMDVDRGWATYHLMGIAQHEQNRRSEYNRHGEDLRYRWPFARNVRFDAQVPITLKILWEKFLPFADSKVLRPKYRRLKSKVQRSIYKRGNKIGLNLKIEPKENR